MPFFTLAELNRAIAALLIELNGRAFKKLPGSRQTLFDTLDRPALGALPATPYQYAEWKRARVNIDYHIDVEGHYYSVPYALVRHQLELVSEGQAFGLPSTSLKCFIKANAWPATPAPTSKAVIPP
jgi:hypothetical protein